MFVWTAKRPRRRRRGNSRRRRRKRTRSMGKKAADVVMSDAQTEVFSIPSASLLLSLLCALSTHYSALHVAVVATIMTLMMLVLHSFGDRQGRAAAERTAPPRLPALPTVLHAPARAHSQVGQVHARQRQDLHQQEGRRRDCDGSTVRLCIQRVFHTHMHILTHSLTRAAVTCTCRSTTPSARGATRCSSKRTTTSKRPRTATTRTRASSST